MKKGKEKMLEQSKIDTIIINVAKQNKGMELNEIKRKIKDEIKTKINSEIASKINVEYIIEVIKNNRDVIFENSGKQNRKVIKNYKNKEGER